MPEISQPNRPPPTTFEYIEAVALRQPQRLAVVDGTSAWSFGLFYLDLIRFTEALDDLGIQRGQRVAVSKMGFYIELALLLACENLGAVTTSHGGEGDPDTPTQFGLVHWILSDRQAECPASARLHLIDQPFVDKVLQIDPHKARPCPRVVLAFGEPHRITRTSGSSGRSRFMALSREAQECWIRTGAENGGYSPDTKLLVASPLMLNASYARSCACLRLGAAVISTQAEHLPRLDITHILALPMRLEELLDELPRGFVSTTQVVVGTVGGFVSPALRDRAQAVFRGRILSRYGTNETTGICDDLDSAGVGVLSAGVDVRIVDGDGSVLPMGEYGIVCARTSGMPAGYIDEPDATAAAFKGGWFHTGDWGALVGPRKLQLAGRHDDLLNVAGLKIPAAAVEDRIRKIDGVRDCAVLAVNLQSAAVTLGVALVVDSQAPKEAVIEGLRAVLPPGAGSSARVIFIDALPRMSTGKLDRIALQRQFQSQS